jgi:hypothetical protein
VESHQLLRSVLEVARGILVLIVLNSNPLSFVLKLPIAQSDIHNLIDFPFLLIIDFYWQSWVRNLAGQRRRLYGTLEFVWREHWVNLNRIRQF